MNLRSLLTACNRLWGLTAQLMPKLNRRKLMYWETEITSDTNQGGGTTSRSHPKLYPLLPSLSALRAIRRYCFGKKLVKITPLRLAD